MRNIRAWCEANNKEPFAHPRSDARDRRAPASNKKERIGSAPATSASRAEVDRGRKTDKQSSARTTTTSSVSRKANCKHTLARPFYLGEAPSPAQRRRSLW